MPPLDPVVARTLLGELSQTTFVLGPVAAFEQPAGGVATDAIRQLDGVRPELRRAATDADPAVALDGVRVVLTATCERLTTYWTELLDSKLDPLRAQRVGEAARALRATLRTLHPDAIPVPSVSRWSRTARDPTVGR